MAHQKWPLAQLISLVERNLPGACAQRHQVMQALSRQPGCRDGLVVASRVRQGQEVDTDQVKCADNFSILTRPARLQCWRSIPWRSVGWALLGDRTRMQLPVNDARIFFSGRGIGTGFGYGAADLPRGSLYCVRF